MCLRRRRRRAAGGARGFFGFLNVCDVQRLQRMMPLFTEPVAGATMPSQAAQMSFLPPVLVRLRAGARSSAADRRRSSMVGAGRSLTWNVLRRTFSRLGSGGASAAGAPPSRTTAAVLGVVDEIACAIDCVAASNDAEPCGAHGFEHALLRGGCAHAALAAALYAGFDAVGLQYGPGYRTLVEAWGGGGVAAARLQARSTAHGTRVHPADLDAALQLPREVVEALGRVVRMAEHQRRHVIERVPHAVDELFLADAS